MKDLHFENLLNYSLKTLQEYKEKEKEVKKNFEPVIEYLREKYPDLIIKSRIKKTRLVVVIETGRLTLEERRLLFQKFYHGGKEELGFKDFSGGGGEIKLAFW